MSIISLQTQKNNRLQNINSIESIDIDIVTIWNLLFENVYMYVTFLTTY